MSSIDSSIPVSVAPEERRSAPARRRAAERFVGWIVPVLALIAWEILSRTGVFPPNWLPGPAVIAQTVVEEATHGALLQHIGVTVLRVLFGFALGAALGTIFGAVTGYFGWGFKLLDPTFQAMRSVPSLAWVPLFLLWLGIQETSKISLVAVGAFFPVYLETSAAMRHVDSKLIEVGRLYRLTPYQMIRRIILPATLPQYFVGLRGGLGLAWMFVVAAELMGASRGLGYLMMDGQMTGRASIIVACVVLFAIFGKITDLILEGVAHFVLRHRSA
jgi:sulfonate transport system permease protein